ncbi:MAG: hypothetical protein ACJA1E_001601 [Paracoccaceae bacterium]|jgi:hypothetical protein
MENFRLHPYACPLDRTSRRGFFHAPLETNMKEFNTYAAGKIAAHARNEDG